MCVSEKIFKLHKGGRVDHPPKSRPTGPKPKCTSICAKDAGGGTTCSSAGAGGLATVETHRPQKGVEKEKRV